MKNQEATPPNARQLLAARRKNLTPKAISVAQDDMVRLSQLPSGGTLPLVIEPNLEGLDLATWARSNAEFIEAQLLRHGGLLFRGFGVRGRDDFEQFLHALPIPLMHYMEGATPRVELHEKVYSSTEFPADQAIALHNELCYVMTWPMKIWFCCVKAAERGGETPIGDVRRVLQRLDPKIRRRFEEKGWMLLRNFGDGMGIPWQKSFRVETPAEAEDYFRRAKIEFEWKGPDRLRTRQVRPAITKHPRTGDLLWFNHIAFWHVSSLEPSLREMFLSELGEVNLPYNTYYGDGTPIEDSVAAELRAAYEEETVAFLWQEGDIMMLDNMLVAHGRKPFAGERKVLAAMGEPFSRQPN
jgi:alpha-ketoglutarate-dependent taurine dioxygenase